jgi:hypothetical protein
VAAGRPSSVAKHVTVRASGTQFSAQFRSVRPSLSAGPDPRGAHLTYDVTHNDVRLTASKDRRVLLLQLTISALARVGPPTTSTPHGFTVSFFGGDAGKVGSPKMVSACLHGT